MSACTRCRWGTGTTSERVVDTEASLEMKQRLASLQAERAQLDTCWVTGTEDSTALVLKETKEVKKINTQIKTSKEITSLADLKAERERQDNLWK
jgi:hypothetical protein